MLFLELKILYTKKQLNIYKIKIEKQYDNNGAKSPKVLFDENNNKIKNDNVVIVVCLNIAK